jgi:general L-amino acid transport system substrate-binding protein
MKRAIPTILAAACASLSALATPAAAQQTVEAIRQKGFVTCGAGNTVGLSMPDAQSVWRGLDVDTCRAIAVAILGDREKARFVPLTGQQRLVALQTGEVDVLPRTTTWTLRRDANGINFAIPNYFEYTGVLVRKSANVTKPQDLNGAAVCVQTGSTTEVTVADLARVHNIKIDAVLFENTSATRQAFFAGRCDALITDAAALASVRATQAQNPADFIIFPANDKIEALTPSVRHGDDRFFDIVKWSFQALLVAEYLGITQANVDQMLTSTNPDVRRFLGVEPGNGAALGLDERFAYNIVKQLGNYGEIYERNLGQGSPLKLERGRNRLYRDGGLMVPLLFN